jgi:hypothetical protein
MTATPCTGAVVPLATGPGSNGPALWASASKTGASTHQIIPFATLTPIGVLTESAAPSSAKPTAGGTEMLFEFLSGPFGIKVVNGATHAAVHLPGLMFSN